MYRHIALLLTAAIGWAGSARAEVARVDIAKRADIGQSGYEKVAGTVHFSVDPKHARNSAVVDLEKAPRNAAGRVEFSADLYVIRLKDQMRGNGTVLVEVAHRIEGRSTIRLFNRGGPSPDPESDADLGDKFLMRFGFTLAWVGSESNLANAALRSIATRDVATWLKHDRREESSVRRAIVYGASDSGRFLDSFLYQGLNTDERDRQVFDGVIAHAAGATEGLFDNARARENLPKLFYTNTSVDYWDPGRLAALMHATPDGSADLTLPDNVRVYFLAGTQPSPGRFPARPTEGQQPDNPVDHGWVLRSMLMAMQRWLNAGTAPPASAYPTIKDGTLVKAGSIAFPKIPGVTSPRGSAAGPRPLLVPAVDEDGNERGGIRLPDVAVPLATYTGWNVRSASGGAADDLAPLLGSSIPFPTTRAAREAARDPRRSVEERYESRDAYAAKLEQVGDALVLKGYVIYDDLPRILQRSTDAWDVMIDKPERF